jgi:predicted permease
MSRTKRHPFREEFAPLWFLAGCLGFLGLIAVGISSENRAVDLVSGFGAILILLAPFLLGAMLSPVRKAKTLRGRAVSRRASRIFAVSAVVSLVLAVAGFLREAYESMGVAGFAALIFTWAAASNDRQGSEP